MPVHLRGPGGWSRSRATAGGGEATWTWWLLLGVPVIVAVTYDAVVTVLSATSAGARSPRR